MNRKALMIITVLIIGTIVILGCSSSKPMVTPAPKPPSVVPAPQPAVVSPPSIPVTVNDDRQRIAALEGKVLELKSQLVAQEANVKASMTKNAQAMDKLVGDIGSYAGLKYRDDGQDARLTKIESDIALIKVKLGI